MLLYLLKRKVNEKGVILLQTNEKSGTDSGKNYESAAQNEFGGPNTPATERKLNITIIAAMASVAVALVLTIIKALAAQSSGSNAILASLADSFLDLVASGVTLFSVKYAQTPPDDDHRYGHGKAEALAGVFQAGLVAISCVLIGISSIQRLLTPKPLLYEGAAIGVMLVSILLTIMLVSLQTWALRKTSSIATKGDRAHYMSDLLSNVAALLGVLIASRLGLLWADAVAGLLITAWLLYGAWHIAAEAADHLLDKEASKEIRLDIAALAKADDKVRGIHDLRTRISGPWLHIQFHMDLPPDIALIDAHEIVVAAEKRIREKYPDADIIIHPDPEDAAEAHGHPEFGEGRKAKARKAK